VDVHFIQQAAFGEKAILSPIYVFGTFVENQMAGDERIFFWVFCSIALPSFFANIMRFLWL
jgi:hypothetical protein